MVKRKRTASGGSRRPRQYVRLTPLSQFAGPARRYPVRSGGFKGYLGRRSQGEKNYLDTVLTESGTTNFVLLNYPVPGTGPNQRVGRKICIKSVQIRLTISVIVTVTGVAPAVTPAAAMRILLVWDKQVNGAASVPAVSDLFATAGTTNALLNMDNRDRFAILMDKVVSQANTTSTLGFPSQTTGMIASKNVFKKYKKLNHETVFNAGTAGDQSDIVSGGLYLVLCSDAQGSSTNSLEVVNFTGNARIRYEDK